MRESETEKERWGRGREIKGDRHTDRQTYTARQTDKQTVYKRKQNLRILRNMIIVTKTSKGS